MAIYRVTDPDGRVTQYTVIEEMMPTYRAVATGEGS